jgi:hypothetical protein
MNLTEVTDLTSIGTLFAFILVAGGILILNPLGLRSRSDKGFIVPYFSSRKFLFPILMFVILIVFLSTSKDSLLSYFEGKTFLELIKSNSLIPYCFFILGSTVISINAIYYRWSLIPVLALLTNLYLMSELGITNWLRFGIWLVAGLILYFSFGFRNSKLRQL